MDIWSILMAVGLPSTIIGAVVGLFFRRIEKKLDAEKAERAKADEALRTYEAYQLKLLNAITALCKANAIALKNGKCNGETKAALEYLDQVKHEYRDHLQQQGIEHLF